MKCMVHGCTNHTDQGTFAVYASVGADLSAALNIVICQTCWNMITSGVVGPSNNFIADMNATLVEHHAAAHSAMANGGRAVPGSVLTTLIDKILSNLKRNHVKTTGSPPLPEHLEYFRKSPSAGERVTARISFATCDALIERFTVDEHGNPDTEGDLDEPLQSAFINDAINAALYPDEHREQIIREYEERNLRAAHEQTRLMRNDAKIQMFGSETNFAERVRQMQKPFTEEDAKRMMEQWTKHWPDIKAFYDDTKKRLDRLESYVSPVGVLHTATAAPPPPTRPMPTDGHVFVPHSAGWCNVCGGPWDAHPPDKCPPGYWPRESTTASTKPPAPPAPPAPPTSPAPTAASIFAKPGEPICSRTGCFRPQNPDPDGCTMCVEHCKAICSTTRDNGFTHEQVQLLDKAFKEVERLAMGLLPTEIHLIRLNNGVECAFVGTHEAATARMNVMKAKFAVTTPINPENPTPRRWHVQTVPLVTIDTDTESK